MAMNKIRGFSFILNRLGCVQLKNKQRSATDFGDTYPLVHLKTCGMRGSIHAKFGCGKKFECPACKATCNRDAKRLINDMTELLVSAWPCQSQHFRNEALGICTCPFGLRL